MIPVLGGRERGATNDFGGEGDAKRSFWNLCSSTWKEGPYSSCQHQSCTYASIALIDNISTMTKGVCTKICDRSLQFRYTVRYGTHNNLDDKCGIAGCLMQCCSEWGCRSFAYIQSIGMIPVNVISIHFSLSATVHLKQPAM